MKKLLIIPIILLLAGCTQVKLTETADKYNVTDELLNEAINEIKKEPVVLSKPKEPMYYGYENEKGVIVAYANHFGEFFYLDENGEYIKVIDVETRDKYLYNIDK